MDLVEKLPLRYLFSKPELRPYAVEKAGRLLLKPAIVSTLRIKRDIFSLWHSLPPRELSDHQVKFLVIAKCLSNLLQKQLGAKFKWWAFATMDRFKESRLKYVEDCAISIQRWWRHMKVVKNRAYQMLSHAITMCLQRRQAIRHIIEHERVQRRYLNFNEYF